MKCSNCGTELEQGARFCQLCGQSVEGSAANENMQEVSSSQAPHNNGGRKTGLKVAAGVVAAAVVVGAVAFAAPKLYQGMKTSNMTPTEYYQYVEKKNRDKSLSGAMDYYDQALSSVWNENGYNKNINMKISASDAAKSMLSMTGIDCSNLADIELDETVNMQEDEMAIQMVVNANADRLISYKMYCDYENKKFYTQIPELSENYIDMSAIMQEIKQEAEDGSSVSFSGNAMLGMAGISDMMKLYPKTSDIKAIYNRYTDLYIDSVKNVEKTEGSCEAQGVSQKADEYTVTLKDAELAQFTKTVLDELKKDENVKTIVENIDKEAYTTLVERLEEIGSDIGEGDKTAVTMNTHITEDEKIIGRSFTLSDDGGANVLKISYLCPTDGENFGAEFAVSLDGEELVKFTGNGTIKNEKMNGDFVLGVGDTLAKQASLADPSAVLKLTLEDYDFSKLSEGSNSGTMVLSTDAVSQLANCSLKYDFTTVKNNGSGILSVLMGQEVLLTADIKVKEAEKLTDIAPKDGDKVYDFSNDKDMEEFAESFDEDELLENILDKLGIDTSGLAGLMGQMYGAAALDDLAS